MNTINKLIITGVFASIMVVLAVLAPNVASAQYNGCYNNNCDYNNYNNYNYNNYDNCTYHAYKLCVGNSIYWYSSCGAQQDLYTNCVGNQTCQYGQCTNYIQPVVIPQNNYQPNYIAHHNISCYGSSLYWYDSRGAFSGIYKSCADKNSCTADTCSAGKCVNTTKCDGSTCVIDSADYNTYCATKPVVENKCGNGNCEANLGETTATCPRDCKTSSGSAGLSVSLFTKQDSTAEQWQKTSEVGPNSMVYFMISATNNSANQIDNVNISANIPTEVASLGNLKVDGVAISGDIVTGVDIGSIAPNTTKLITFEGKTRNLSEASAKQATAKSNVSGANQSDYISINLNPSKVSAAVSNTSASSGFWAFLTRWFLWIIGGLILAFLFIIVYRRISLEV